MSELKASYFKDSYGLSHVHDWEPGTQIHIVRPRLGFAPLALIAGVVGVIAGVIAVFTATPFLALLLDLNLDVWGWPLTIGFGLFCGCAVSMTLYSALPFREVYIDWDLGTFRGVERKQKISRDLEGIRSVVIQPMTATHTSDGESYDEYRVNLEVHWKDGKQLLFDTDKWRRSEDQACRDVEKAADELAAALNVEVRREELQKSPGLVRMAWTNSGPLSKASVVAMIGLAGFVVYSAVQPWLANQKLSSMGADVYSFSQSIRGHDVVDDAKAVEIENSNVDEQLKRLVPHMQHIKRLALDLSESDLTNEGLKTLANLPNLVSLRVCETRVSNEGLGYLTQLKNLVHLDISLNPQLGDEAIEIVSEMSNLRFLEFRVTAVSDKSIDFIAKLQYLELISIFKCQMSEQGKAMLKQAFPNGEVF